MNIQHAVLMRDFTSLHIGGECDLVVVCNEHELVEAIDYAKAKGFRLHVLGGGTNTFFGEDLKELLVIKIEMKGISVTELGNDSSLLHIAAGEFWDDVVQFAVDNNLWGIENLSLIPGTVGAAPVQNIGAYGVELKDVFHTLRVYDKKEQKFVELSLSDCQFGYRDSIFKKEKDRYIIVSVTLKLSKIRSPILTYKPLDALQGKENITLKEIRDLVIATRQAKLPDWKVHPNAGSFFKNTVIKTAEAEGLRTKYPEIPLHELDGEYKVPTAWLIEHVAQMKGVREGDVGTWPNQPLVLVNYGSATADELMQFSQNIIDIVREKTGIALEREVNGVI